MSMSEVYSRVTHRSLMRQLKAELASRVLHHIDEIDRLRDENERLRQALEWYAEHARLAHSGGDSGRYAIASDGGKRARAALTPPQPEQEGQRHDD